MSFTFSEKMHPNKILVITCWEGKNFCNVFALKPEKQTEEEIAIRKKRAVALASRPGAPRNGLKR